MKIIFCFSFFLQIVFINKNLASLKLTKLSSIITNFEDNFIENYLDFKKVELSLTNNFLNTPDDIFSD